ncbi:MAG TPA: hypothetical protein VFE77_09890 [Rhodanobacter sp.]|nr:hypothetical protein [Rhodanobacter sp.]
MLHRLRWPGITLLIVLSSILLWSWLPTPDETAELPAANQLVHWQDAGHDWLLVVDPLTRELVVYDAHDGRPLRRLGADEGLPPLRAIVQRGSWLFVMGMQQPRVRRLKLPELQAVALRER